MEIRYIIMLLVLPLATPPTNLMCMQSTVPTTMQVVQAPPPMQITTTILSEVEGKAAKESAQAGYVQQINGQGININPQHFDEELAKLEKEANALINATTRKIIGDWEVVNTEEVLKAMTELGKALAGSTQKNTDECIKDWQIINKNELAHIKAELKQAQEANEIARQRHSRLYDWVLGATALTAAEACAVYAIYHEEIRYIYEHRKQLSAIWEAILELMA